MATDAPAARSAGPRSWFARLWPAATYQFCFIASLAMLKPGANALVLSRFNSQAMPWLYLAAAVITGGLALWGAARPWRRLGPQALALLGALTAGACALGVWAQAPFVSVGAYLFAESFATQVSLAFWAAVGEAFDARESRRAFTWINGVGMSGAIFGGLLAQELAGKEGATALLVSGGALLMVAGLVWQFHHYDAEGATPVRERAAWSEVLAVPYTQLLAGLVLALALLQMLIDYVFRERAAQQLVEAAMASLFASHQLWTGVFCVLFQFVVAELLLRRLGILRYVGLVPIGLGAVTVYAYLVPSVWSVWALKVLEGAASWSFMPVAMQLLYAPLPDEARDRVRRTIDGVLRKLGMGVAGLLLIVAAPRIGADGVLVVSGGLCLAVGVVLVRLRPRYIEAVHARVAGFEPARVFDTEQRLLAVALRSDEPERVLRAVDLLERADALTPFHVLSLLAHQSERVQDRGVQLAEEMRLIQATRQLEALITRPGRRPRDNAVWALAALNPERAAVVLRPLLHATDVGLLSAAVGGSLLVNPVDPTARHMLGLLLEQAEAGPPATRREVARLLGRLGKDPTLPKASEDPRARALQRLLDDSDPTVRKLAIRATGEGHFAELAPRLLRFLSWRDDRREAREALALLGDQVVPLLASTLDDRTRALALRLQLPRVLRRIATQSALDALLFSNAEDEPSLHFRVGLALVQLHEDAPTIHVEEARVLRALARFSEAWRALVPPWLDVRAALGDQALLSRALGDRLDQAVALCFAMLGLVHDPRSMRRVFAQLRSSDRRRRAWALELVENVLSPQEKDLVLEQVEAPHWDRPAGDAAALEQRVAVLAKVEDSVLRACARKVARAEGWWPAQLKEDDMNDQILKRLFALEGVEIFAQNDVDDLAAVASVAKERRFRAGEKVYLEGDPGDALYVIVSGSAEARREGEVVLTMKARESFGETSLFDGAPRINEVVATGDMECLVIDRRDFLDLLSDRPELLSGMFRVLSRQLKSMVVEVAARRATTGEIPIPVVTSEAAPK